MSPPAVRHLLVEDSDALAGIAERAGLRLWSQSTGLSYTEAARGLSVRALDDPRDAPAFEALWRDLAAVRLPIARALRAAENPEGLTHLGQVLGHGLYVAAVQIATKALMLALWRERLSGAEAIVAGAPALSPPAGLNPGVGIHDHLFAAIAERLPAEAGIALRSCAPVPPDRFLRSFAHVPPLDRLFNSVNRPVSSLCFKLWRRRGRPTGSGARGRLLLLRENELLEEAFLPLRRDGWRIESWPIPDRRPETAPEPASGRLSDAADRALSQLWTQAVGPHLPPAFADAGARLWRERLAGVLAEYPARLAGMRAWAAKAGAGGVGGAGGRPTVALSTGLYAPLHRMADAALREEGIPVVCADHGTGVGIQARLDATADAYVGFSDLYLAFNPAIGALFERAVGPEGGAVEIVGAPSEIARARFPRLQRAVMRRRLKLAPRETVLTYVTGLGQNNLLGGAGAGLDAVYAAFQRDLVACLEAFPGRASIKPYPAHRFPDPEQIWTMPLPECVHRQPFGEFRHSRWAADLLLLDLTSSTLSWALGCGRPVIYVDNPIDPMNEAARRAASRALFLIDPREEDWRQRLRALLSQDIARTRAAWRDMAAARREFSARFVLGPSADPAAAPGAAVAAALRRDWSAGPRRRIGATLELEGGSG